MYISGKIIIELPKKLTMPIMVVEREHLTRLMKIVVDIMAFVFWEDI